MVEVDIDLSLEDHRKWRALSKRYGVSLTYLPGILLSIELLDDYKLLRILWDFE